jgi:hypothetical protein
MKRVEEGEEVKRVQFKIRQNTIAVTRKKGRTEEWAVVGIS